MAEFAFTVSLMDAVTGPAKMMASAIKGMSSALTATAGTIDGFASKVKNIPVVGGIASATLSKTGKAVGTLAENFEALAEPAAAGIEVIGGLVAEGAKFGIEASEMREQTLSMLSAFGGGEAAGAATLGMLDKLTQSLPQSKDKLADWTEQFQRMGMTNIDQLQTQVKAVSAAQVLGGDAGAEAFTDISKSIQEAILTSGKFKVAILKQKELFSNSGATAVDVARQMGISQSDLASKLADGTINAKAFGDALNQALIEKGKGPSEKLMGSLSVISSKFHDNIMLLFEGIDVKPLTDGLQSLVGLFGAGSASGDTMKAVVTGLFNGLFQLAAKVIPIVKMVFLQMIIWGLKAYIFIKPFIPLLKLIGMTLVVAAGLVAATFIPTMIAAAAGIMGVVGAALLAAAPFIAFAALIVGVYEAFTHWGAIKSFVSDIFGSIANIGEQFIQGLVDGIKNGVGLVVNAVKGLASSAMGALKGALGIASPSKVMMSFGKFTGAGLAQGITGTQDQVKNASSGLADAAQAGAASGASSMAAPSAAAMNAPGGGDSGGSVKGGKGAISVVVEAGAISINGAGKSAMDITEDMVSVVFERIALTQGI